MCTFGDVPTYQKGFSLMLGAQLPKQEKGETKTFDRPTYLECKL
jgi:hypothetical protein